jgi:hypothetical protein
MLTQQGQPGTTAQAHYLGQNPTNPLTPTPGAPGIANYANAKGNSAAAPGGTPAQPRNPYISQVP